MLILLAIHSLVRWIIVIIGLIAVCTLAQGWLSKRPYSRFDRGISLSFSLSMALQFLLGLPLLLWMGFAGGGFTLARIVHTVILTGAVYVSAMPPRWKQAEDAIRLRNSFYCVLATLILIVIGVVAVGGW